MSATGFAIFAIITIAIAVWMFLVGRDPKRWRLIWLDTFGVLDSDTERHERRQQETHLRFAAFLLCLLFATTSLSLIFWAVDDVRETRRPKSAVEIELDQYRRSIEGNARR